MGDLSSCDNARRAGQEMLAAAIADDEIFDPLAYPTPTSAIDELKKIPQWVSWRYADRGGPKPTKPPVSPNTGRGASITNPRDWSTYEKAVWRAKVSNLAGYGFVLSETDDYTGVDLDACVNADTGKIEPWAIEILDFAETYAEFSPSKTGIRMFVRGKIERSRLCKPANVEIYRSERYLTVTGDHIFDTPEDIRPAPKTLALLMARIEQYRPKDEPDFEKLPAASPTQFTQSTDDNGALAWAKVALEKRCERLADMGKDSGRNIALNAVAYSLGRIIARGWIEESACRAALEDACKKNGTWKEDGPKQCRATINSGMRSGKMNPRPDLPEREEDRELQLLIDDIDRRLEEEYAEQKLIEDEDGNLIDQETGEVVKLAKSPTSAVSNELPEHLTKPAGVLGDIVNWVTDSAINPSRVLSLGAAISVVGTVIGRRVAGPTKSGTHQYIIALAPSGGGKDHPLRRAAAQLIAVNSWLVGPGDFTSQNAFIQHVSVTPLSMCPMDELGVFVARACDKKGTSWERGMTKVLREYWGASFETVQGMQWADRKSEPIEWPALSLFGVSTHEEFFGALSSKEVTNGFLNRFLMLSTVADTIDVDEPIASKSKIPEDIVCTLTELYANCMGGDPASSVIIDERVAQRLNEDSQIEIGWADDQVFDEYRELRKRARAKRKASTVGEVYSRTAEIAVRLATIHAVSRAGLDAKLNSADLAWGRELAMWSADTMAREASLRMADSPAQKNAKLVLLKITDAGGTLKHRDLHRALRYELNPTGFKEATTMLAESGAIQIAKVKPPKGGREVVTYTLTKEGEA